MLINRRTALAGLAATAACTAPSRPVMLDVVVIGAGLAGLNAALLLEEAGARVTVLEARNRIGGRLQSLENVPGNPEAGGNEIGASYGRVRGAMERYGVPMVPLRPRTEGIEAHAIMALGDRLVPLETWAQNSANPFPAAYRSSLPWHLEFNVFGPANPLSSPSDITNPDHAALDISVAKYLGEKGFSDAAIQLGAGTNMGQGNAPDALSVLHWMHVMAFVAVSGGGGVSVAAKGGNQRIPEAMAAALSGDVRTNAPVLAVSSEPDGVRVLLASAEIVRARRLIVTAPFPALKNIGIDAPVPPVQREAFHALGYTRVTQLHFRPKRAFWEDDGLPPSMWTDAMGRFLALYNNPNDPSEITSFVLYANDRVAAQFDALSVQDATGKALSYLARIRPSTRGALDFIDRKSWQNDHYSGGAYAAWKPGQVTAFGTVMARPIGNIHIAGADTSLVTRGMEAAMESGERAAFEVLERL